MIIVVLDGLNQQVVKQKLTGLQWIADVSFIEQVNLQTPHYMPYLQGILGVAIRRGEIPGFKDFLLKIHPDNYLDISHENIIVSLVFDFSIFV